MTTTIPTLPDTTRAALQARLDGLLAQRTEVFAEATAAGATGDAADRAGNVEAIIRLEELDARIAQLHEKLSAPVAPRSGDTDTVQVGSRVTIRFGGEPDPEPFLVGLLEEAGTSVEVITPTSPLGRALLGARSGDSVEYRSAAGRALSATVVDVEG